MASLLKKQHVRFFKIMLDDTICSGKLCIPRKFVRNYGKNLSSSVLLMVANDAVWKVELAKCDGEIWLQKGWPEFVDHYSLAHGHLVVFEFNQIISSHFNVLIFDKSASEIDYPPNNSIEHDHEHDLKEIFEEPDIKEIENDATSESMDDRPHVKMNVEGKRSHGVMSCQKATSDSDKNIVARTQSLSVKEKARAVKRASAKFKSKYPFFMSVMQPSYVFSENKVTMPPKFARKHFHRKYGDAILNVADGRSWPVKYYVPNLFINRSATAKITHGWRVFVLDNELEVGDVCAFELIKGTKTTFRVSIFRGNEGSNKQSLGEEGTGRKLVQTPSCSNLTGAIEAAKKFTVAHPCFKVVMGASYIENCIMNVPAKFIVSMQKISIAAKLQVKNRCWPVKLHIYPDQRKSQMSKGWHEFARENSLQVGDVCIFELTDRETMLINVTIFRHGN